MSDFALWYVAAGRAELRPVAAPGAGANRAVVRTLWSGLSRGTERLVFNGSVPASEHERMRAPLQEGDFPFPVKYGYACVGRVEQGPSSLLGRLVFALHPHQSVLIIDAAWLRPVPDQVPPRRAVLAANMETALNAAWDSGAGPGDRIVVVGAGVVGLLTAHLLARLPGAEVTVVDPDPGRAAVAERLGCGFSTDARGLPRDADLAIHASGHPDGLATALDLVGDEGRIVEMSWYGDRLASLPLGAAFHSRRLTLASSQVGQVSPGRRPRWTHARRLEKALDLLADDRLDDLITEEVAFRDLPAELPRLLAPGAPGLGLAIRYDGPA